MPESLWRFSIPMALLVVGIIHLLPLSGALGVSRLSALYGIDITDLNLSILMRHRALLFGLLGAFLIYAAMNPGLYLIALIAGSVSVLSFLWLAIATGGYNDELKRVVIVDVIALIFLTIGFIALFVKHQGVGE